MQGIKIEIYKLEKYLITSQYKVLMTKILSNLGKPSMKRTQALLKKVYTWREILLSKITAPNVQKVSVLTTLETDKSFFRMYI